MNWLRGWLAACGRSAMQRRLRRQRRDPYVRLACATARIHELRRELAAARHCSISLAMRLARAEAPEAEE